jgi:AcrR family transcriptional regulator
MGTPAVRATKAATPALRADAAENRRRLIEAARAVFAERGIDAPIDEIARRAGVGNATLYRRFRTRADLVAAVFEERLSEYASAAEEALRSTDAWAGFCQYVQRICEMQVGDRGLAEVLTTTFPAAPQLQAQRERAYNAFATLVGRAQAAGQLRADFVVEDFTVLMMANVGVVRGTAELAAPTLKRFTALVLDGWRAEAAHLLPPPLPPAELHGVMRGLVGRARAPVDDLPAAEQGS